MTIEQAKRVADHLIKTKQGFCYINEGELISREYLTEAYGINFDEEQNNRHNPIDFSLVIDEIQP